MVFPSHLTPFTFSLTTHTELLVPPSFAINVVNVYRTVYFLSHLTYAPTLHFCCYASTTAVTM